MLSEDASTICFYGKRDFDYCVSGKFTTQVEFWKAKQNPQIFQIFVCMKYEDQQNFTGFRKVHI